MGAAQDGRTSQFCRPRMMRPAMATKSAAAARSRRISWSLMQCSRSDLRNASGGEAAGWANRCTTSRPGAAVPLTLRVIAPADRYGSVSPWSACGGVPRDRGSGVVAGASYGAFSPRTAAEGVALWEVGRLSLRPLGRAAVICPLPCSIEEALWPHISRLRPAPDIRPPLSGTSRPIPSVPSPPQPRCH